jgi:hypothetical protein
MRIHNERNLNRIGPILFAWKKEEREKNWFLKKVLERSRRRLRAVSTTEGTSWGGSWACQRGTGVDFMNQFRP